MACKCGCEFIVNKKYQLCNDCNYKRLHNGETVKEAYIRKQRQKVRVYTPIKRKSVIQAKKRQKPIKSTDKTKEKRKELLQKDRETYYEVFLSKPHQCENCSQPLPDEFEDENGNIIYIEQYSHILSKGSSPEFRHKVINLNRLCGDCHKRWEFKDKENMKIYANNQIIIQKLRDEYNKQK